MLFLRIFSAIIMAVLFVCGIFVLEKNSFILIIGIVALFAGWEWTRLSGVQATFLRVVFTSFVGLLCFLIRYLGWQKNVLYISPFVWLIAFHWVINYPSRKLWRFKVSRLVFGLVALSTAWCAIAVLKESNNFIVWILLLMGLVWGTDSGAYFFGQAFNKNKLAPKVSPGKSWEGVMGGIIFTQIGLALFSYLVNFSFRAWGILLSIGLITVFFSVLGDLMESLLKRHESMKDSGHLIPGHGGLMDRVDSLTAAAPIYVLLLSVLGWL